MADVWAFERSGYHKGLYHVIGGLLSASKNFTEQDLNLNKLKERIINNQVQEIILALSATIEGQTTALVIKDKLESQNIKITQLVHFFTANAVSFTLSANGSISSCLFLIKYNAILCAER